MAMESSTETHSLDTSQLNVMRAVSLNLKQHSQAHNDSCKTTLSMVVNITTQKAKHKHTSQNY